MHYHHFYRRLTSDANKTYSGNVSILLGKNQYTTSCLFSNFSPPSFLLFTRSSALSHLLITSLLTPSSPLLPSPNYLSSLLQVPSAASANQPKEIKKLPILFQSKLLAWRWKVYDRFDGRIINKTNFAYFMDLAVVRSRASCATCIQYELSQYSI